MGSQLDRVAHHFLNGVLTMAAPRKYPPEDAAEMIERLAEQGFTIIGISKRLGVARETFKRWCEEDSELQEAFENGRETLRQALISLIVQAAVAGKGANGNSMFLLKTMFGFREFDSPYAKVDVAIAVAPVLIVRDFGTDAQWAVSVAAQQKALTADSTSPQTMAPQAAHIDAQPYFGPPVILAPAFAPQASPIPRQTPQYEAPVWRPKS